MERTCDVDVYLAVVNLATHVGLEVEPYPVDPESSRVPVSVYRELWDRLDEVRTSDRWFAAKAGAAANLPGTVATVAFAVGTKPTILDGFKTMIRAYRLVNEGVHIDIVQEGEAKLIRRVDLDGPGGGFTEAQFASAFYWSTATKMCGRPLLPLVVRFRHVADRMLAKQGEEIFGCPVELGAQDDGLVYSDEALQMQLLRSDPELSDVLDAAVDRSLGSLPSGEAEDLVRTVRDHVSRHLTEDFSVSAVAKLMGLHERTLQRRLKDEGKSYSEIVDDVRHRLAVQHIKNDSLNLAEIAFLVGFSEPAAFTRAFRKWTGQAPSVFRRELTRPSA